MDGELVNSSPSDHENVDDGGDELRKATPLESHEAAFWHQFPYYIALGMSEKQYWEGDCQLTKAFREADKIRRDRMNQQAWLQGMYFYDALSRISPLLHAFGKKGAKAEPYVKEPYPMDPKQVEETRVKQEKQAASKGLRYMQDMVFSSKKRFSEGK